MPDADLASRQENTRIEAVFGRGSRVILAHNTSVTVLVVSICKEDDLLPVRPRSCAPAWTLKKSVSSHLVETVLFADSPRDGDGK